VEAIGESRRWLSAPPDIAGDLSSILPPPNLRVTMDVVIPPLELMTIVDLWCLSREPVSAVTAFRICNSNASTQRYRGFDVKRPAESSSRHRLRALAAQPIGLKTVGPALNGKRVLSARRVCRCLAFSLLSRGRRLLSWKNRPKNDHSRMRDERRFRGGVYMVDAAAEVLERPVAGALVSAVAS
jgi:hypothetical protein